MRGRFIAFGAAVVLLAASGTGASGAGGEAWAKRLEAGRSFWAFQTPEPTMPPPTASAWVRTDIDAFVLERLHEKGLEPSAPADSERLLRRVYLDLTGLPPTPEQAREFLDDSSPRAYENLVERLLASPHYGERWALKWLDVVRYADTNGFEQDAYREHAWRYRDYVVESFHNDKPYDRFVQEQIAGDELFPGSDRALIATGFHRMGPRHVVGGNQDEELSRQELLTEMTVGVGSVFLGLTVHCARCHDHKFDPIAQADYYRLQAFFAATDLAEPQLASAEQVAAYDQAKKSYDTRLEPLREQLELIEKPYREQVIAAKKASLEPRFLEALETPEGQRDEKGKRLADEAMDQIKAAWYELLALVPQELKTRRAELRRRMHAIELEEPDPPAAAFAVANMREPPPTHILKTGDHRHKLDAVEPGFLSAADSYGVEPPVAALGRRTALARWLTAPEHPLTARVMVNRIWEFRMGRGLVEDPNNFGLLGGMPSHPELLDYLASRFVELGWSVKAIDRMIVLSSAYKQAAGYSETQAKIDPDNKLYWRANRRRLEGDTIRDGVLAASGSLNRAVGGKPVLVPIEPELYDLIFTEGEPDNLWPVTPDSSQHNRRSLYLLNRRTVRLPMLANFDQPDTMTSCSIRPVSTHALQSLTMLNSEFMQQQAGALAQRLSSACGSDSECLVERSYAYTLARRPTVEERRLAEEFLAGDDAQLSDFSLAMLNRNEFVYRP